MEASGSERFHEALMGGRGSSLVGWGARTDLFPPDLLLSEGSVLTCLHFGSTSRYALLP